MAQCCGCLEPFLLVWWYRVQALESPHGIRDYDRFSTMRTTKIFSASADDEFNWTFAERPLHSPVGTFQVFNVAVVFLIADPCSLCLFAEMVSLPMDATCPLHAVHMSMYTFNTTVDASSDGSSDRTQRQRRSSCTWRLRPCA